MKTARLLVRYLPIPLLCAASTLASPPPAPAERLIERAIEKKLWEHIQWTRLLNYEALPLLGKPESLADDPTFFIDENGNRDPRAEMLSELRAFYAPVTAENLQREVVKVVDQPTAEELEAERKLRQHPICQFPARLSFLKTHLEWDGSDLPQIKCNRFDQFRQRLSPNAVSLVFSSFFLGSPSSTFGHTLLRIHNSNVPDKGKQSSMRRSELLDTGVNYAANPTVNNPLLYAVFGLAGLFPGTFTAIPYFYKVREYNDFEARDLWSYRLNLTQAELDFLVMHLWEQGGTHYDYFYFTENCATFMLNLLDTAAPRLNLRRRLPYYVIPSATIPPLYAEEDFVLERGYRPSVRREFFYRYERLSSASKDLFHRLVDGEEIEKTISRAASDEEKIELLDTYADFVEYKESSALRREDPVALKKKQSILIARSAIRSPSPPLNMPAPENEAPEKAHGVRRIQPFFGYSDRLGKFAGVNWRFAMHDAIDSSRGYPMNTTVEFFTAKLDLYTKEPWFEAEEIRIFRIESMIPVNRFEIEKSYSADFRYFRRFDPDFKGDGRGGLTEFKLGGGFTLPIFSPDYALGAMIMAAPQFSPNLIGSNLRIAAGPRVFSILNFSEDIKAKLTYENEWRLFSRGQRFWQAGAEARYMPTKHFGLSGLYEHSKTEERTSAAVQWYF